MTLHFTPEEYATRQALARAALHTAGLDALLMFAPESHYWISGYDTFGFALFFDETLVFVLPPSSRRVPPFADLRCNNLIVAALGVFPSSLLSR